MNNLVKRIVDKHFACESKTKQNSEKSLKTNQQHTVPWLDVLANDLDTFQIDFSNLHYAQLQPSLQPPAFPKQQALPPNIYKSEQVRLQVSRQEQWDRILEDKRSQYQANMQRKIQQQRQQQLKFCNKQTKANPQIFQKLYNQGLQEKTFREITHQYLNSLPQNHSFRPKISQAAEFLKARQAPIFQRIDQVLQRQKEQRVALMLQKIKSENITFKPKINENSEQLMKEKQKDVLQRLKQAGIESLNKRIQLIEKQHQRIKEDCTFQPHINPVVEDSKERELKQLIIRKAKEIAQSSFRFQPSINKISQYIIEADPQRASETPAQKIQRLTKGTSDKDILLNKIASQVYKECTFKPHIDEISRKTGKKTSLTDLSKPNKDVDKVNKIKQQITTKQLQQCSFKPVINTKSRQLALNFVPCSSKTNKVKEDMEYSIMKECTFMPKVNQKMPFKQLKLQNMRGMDFFLKNLQQKKQQQQIKKQVQFEKFSLQQRYDAKGRARQKKTQVRPFNLSRSNVNSTRLLQQQLLQAQKKVCTFHPKING